MQRIYPVYVLNIQRNLKTQQEENKPIENGQKNRRFAKVDIQISDTHMKRCSTLLAIREIHIKATVRYHTY